MMDRDNITRSGAKDPWGREERPPEQRHVEAPTVLDSEPGLPLGESVRRVEANCELVTVCREQA
jgi:hypothetical protein